MTGAEPPAALLILADQLKQVRTEAGLTQEQFAERLRFSRPLVAMNETGRQVPSRDYVRRVDELLSTGGRLERIRSYAKRDSAAGRLAELLEVEENSTVIRDYNPMQVSGLLQTREYATAIVGGGPYASLTDDEVDEQAELRMQRQAILFGDRPPQYSVVVGEAALYNRVGGTDIMRGQLEHVVKMMRTERRIRVQVLPFADGQHTLASPITVMDGGDDGPVVYLDGPAGGRPTTDPRIVTECEEWFDVLGSQALSPSVSMEMIEQRMEEL